MIDEKTGQRYQLADFTQKGAGKPRYFGDKGLMAPPPGKHWIWSQERINEALEKGLIIFTQSGKPRVKRFLDESKGKPVEDIWIDIFPIIVKPIIIETHQIEAIPILFPPDKGG